MISTVSFALAIYEMKSPITCFRRKGIWPRGQAVWSRPNKNPQEVTVLMYIPQAPNTKHGRNAYHLSSTTPCFSSCCHLSLTGTICPTTLGHHVLPFLDPTWVHHPEFWVRCRSWKWTFSQWGKLKDGMDYNGGEGRWSQEAGGNDLCPSKSKRIISGLEHVCLEEIQTASPVPQRPELTEILFVQILGTVVFQRVSWGPLEYM